MNDAPPSATWMIYGANGYTGRLIAREAVRRGLQPILAGRRGEAIRRLATELGCSSRVFDLASHEAVVAGLEGVQAVLNCAGPFSSTAVPMMEACLATGTHYLDITGEIEVIEAGHDRHDRAKQAGVTLIPAVGFDVVPTDCLAATLAAELPDANHLEMAFLGLSSLSPGTAKTMAENQHRGGRVRRAGKLVAVPAAWKTMDVPFRSGTHATVTIPWGDVASAFYTTGIPNIEVYVGMPRGQIKWMRRLRPLYGLMAFTPMQRLVKWIIGRRVPGPNDEELKTTHSSLWGRVTNEAGQSVEATMETPGGYPLTVETSLAATLRVLNHEAPTGYTTPAQAFGKDFILEMPETDLMIS